MAGPGSGLVGEVVLAFVQRQSGVMEEDEADDVGAWSWLCSSWSCSGARIQALCRRRGRSADKARQGLAHVGLTGHWPGLALAALESEGVLSRRGSCRVALATVVVRRRGEMRGRQ